MANKKISELTAASTPLTGTEVVPIVQSGTTKRTTVSAVTATGGTALAYKKYAPSSLATYSSTSATLADADATNLILGSFVVPASGAVKVVLSATGRVTFVTNSTWMHWNVRDGSGDIAATTARVAGAVSSGHIFYSRITYELIIDGLTPGATVSGWKWGLARDSSAGGAGITEFYAINTGIPGPAAMEVRAL